ncbi:MAG: DUF131 domain-containing protein [Candidatus Bathyarchaeia archaeon]
MTEKQAEKWFKLFLTLFFVGFLTILLGIILLIVAALLSGTGNASFGGVLFIWFFPIVFGAGPEAHWLILFAIILAVLGVILFIASRRSKVLARG